MWPAIYGIMAQVADSFVWPDVTECTQCKSKEVLVRKSGKGYAHIATVWTGSAWKLVNHATKLCEECGARHKSNYVATLGEKKNTLRNWLRPHSRRAAAEGHGRFRHYVGLPSVSQPSPASPAQPSPFCAILDRSVCCYLHSQDCSILVLSVRGCGER